MVLLAALALLVFAPAALAQQIGDDMMGASASAMMGSASAASASALPTTGGPQVLCLLSVAARLGRGNS